MMERVKRAGASEYAKVLKRQLPVKVMGMLMLLLGVWDAAGLGLPLMALGLMTLFLS